MYAIIWRSFRCVICLCRPQKRLLLFLFASLISSAWIFSEEMYKYSDLNKTKTLIEFQLSEILLTEKGTGCEMPRLDPFSKETMRYDGIIPNITCSGIDWVNCYKSECYVIPQILEEMKDIECTYKDIIYVNDNYYYFGEPTKVFDRAKYALNKSDHVQVSCSGMNVKGFGLMRSYWSGRGAGFRPIHISRENSLNILILMVDSMSRNGILRRMPLSYKALTEDLQAVVLNSYNIVAEASPGALFPILTGHMELELEDSRKTLLNNKLVDLKPFIFRVLKEHGYITSYNEDVPSIGTFQNRFNGFGHQPTDHYLQPFLKEAAERWWNSEKYCLGAAPKHRFLLNNITKQFFELEGKKFCLTHLVELSHDEFNMITASDEDIASFLKTFKADGHLKDTMLIFMGDHGARMGSIRGTYQGKIEERLPFVSIVLPDKLKNERPEALRNLQKNSDTLTTHYDMHTTLLDALGLKKYRNSYKVPGSDIERGLSFFELIPVSRSCAEAGIMPHWCACANWHNVSNTDEIYKKSAEALAAYIDSISEEKRSKCATRKLLDVEWVQRQSPNKRMLGYKAKSVREGNYIGKYDARMLRKAVTEYYQVKIVLSPGRSVFEGSMQYIVKDDFFVISETDVVRVNAYGDEPKCVSASHPHLNKYCYCKDGLAAT